MARFLSPASSASPSPTTSFEDILPPEIAWLSAAAAAASAASRSRSRSSTPSPSSTIDSTDSGVTLVTKALVTPTHSITGLSDDNITTGGNLTNDDSITRGGAQGQDERKGRGVFGWDNGVSIAFFICLALLIVTIMTIIFFIIQRRKTRRNSFGRQQQHGNDTFGLGRWGMRKRRSGFTTRVERGEVNWVRSARDGELAVAQRRNVIFDEATGAVHSAYDIQTSENDTEKKFGFKAAVENLFSGMKTTKSENGNSQVAKEDKYRSGTSHSPSSSSSSSSSGKRARSATATPIPFAYPPTAVAAEAPTVQRNKSRSGDRTVSTVHDENVAIVGFTARYDDDVMGIRSIVPPPPTSNNGDDDDAAEPPSVPRKPSAGRRSLRRGRSDSSRPATSSNSSRHNSLKSNRHNSQRRPSTSSSAASFWKNSAAPIARSLSKSLRKEKRDIDAEIQEIEKEVDLRSESRRSRSRNAIPTSPIPRLPSPVLKDDGTSAVLFAKQHGNGDGEGGLIPVYQRRPTPINVLDNIGGSSSGNNSNGGGDYSDAIEEREKVMWARNHIKR